MTESQNTKNEQQKDLCITSEQLTEQWKKSKLKLGEHYYYTTIFSPNVYIQNFTRDVVSFQDFKETVAEVLEPVPSYEEYQKLKESRAELNSDIVDKAYENAMLKSEYEKECKRADELEDSYWKAEKENTKLKEQINHLSKTQARQFVDDQKLQVKAEKAKDVVNIDTARQIKQLKELLKECELWFTGMVGNMNDKNVGEHNRNLPIGNFEHIFKVFSQKINEALR